MEYLIFDENGELFDMLTFNDEEALNLFQSANPKYDIQKESDFIIDEDEVFIEEDDEDFEWVN